jgi:hypothetical protein
VADLLPSENTQTPNVILTPMEVLRGAVRIDGTAHEVARADWTVWWIEVDERMLGDVTTVDGTAPVDVDITGMDLPPGTHTLEVKVGAGDSPADAAVSPVVRRTFYVRATEEGVELLAPGTAARFVRRPPARAAQWEDTLTVPELQVDPVVAGR